MNSVRCVKMHSKYLGKNEYKQVTKIVSLKLFLLVKQLTSERIVQELLIKRFDKLIFSILNFSLAYF